jgi:ribose transport system permease protein
VLLQVLQNLVNLLGIPSSLNFAVIGGVILIGVLADQQFTRYRQKREGLRVSKRAGAVGEAERAPAGG